MKLGDDIINEIIANRPYSSLDDLLDKVKIGTDKTINLIKAGCFDNIEKDRKKLMMSYIRKMVPDRTKLTTANIPMLIKNNLIPEYLSEEVKLWELKKKIINKSNLYEMINKTQGYYKIKESEIYREILLELNDIKYLDDNNIAINSKEFDAIYDRKTAKLKEWLATDEPKIQLTRNDRNELWNKYCLGNTLRWEMNSVNLYYDKHEIDVIPLDKYFSLSNFEELPSDPEVVNRKVGKKGNIIEEYKLSVIAGAVINKNKDKKYIELSTPSGSVMVKLGGKYNHYNKSSEEDPSWFERGTLLIVVGFRNEDSFIAKTYKDSVYNHSLMKISKYTKDKVNIKMDKIEA